METFCGKVDTWKRLENPTCGSPVETFSPERKKSRPVETFPNVSTCRRGCKRFDVSAFENVSTCLLFSTVKRLRGAYPWKRFLPSKRFRAKHGRGNVFQFSRRRHVETFSQNVQRSDVTKPFPRGGVSKETCRNVSTCRQKHTRGNVYGAATRGDVCSSTASGRPWPCLPGRTAGRGNVLEKRKRFHV